MVKSWLANIHLGLRILNNKDHLSIGLWRTTRTFINGISMIPAGDTPLSQRLDDTVCWTSKLQGQPGGKQGSKVAKLSRCQLRVS